MTELTKLQRLRFNSRLRIIGYLNLQHQVDNGKWSTAREALGPLSVDGPYSEDLQDLVREGLVESTHSPEMMRHTSLVRLNPAKLKEPIMPLP